MVVLVDAAFSSLLLFISVCFPAFAYLTNPDPVTGALRYVNFRITSTAGLASNLGHVNKTLLLSDNVLHSHCSPSIFAPPQLLCLWV